MQEWIETELRDSDLGDARLDARYRILLNRFSQKSSLSIPAACCGHAETVAAYRFLDNPKVHCEDILAPHQSKTTARIAEQKVVLLPQDTTEIEVTRAEEIMVGAGPLNDESRVGFYPHVMLALTPSGIPLGVVDADIYARDWDEFRASKKKRQETKKQERKRRPIEDKESFRWLQGYWKGCEIAEQARDTQVVVISDSEGDIYECFDAARPERGAKKADWLVRACNERNLENGDSQLWETVASAEIMGTIEISVSKNDPSRPDGKRRQARSARTTTATVQAVSVVIKAPKRPGSTKLENVRVNAILVREATTPSNGEDPIEWLLLTSLPIKTLRQVSKAIGYYRSRWSIEIYFRILKSGCQVEASQLETADRYRPCLAIYMIVAWRVMYILMMGRECPELSCEVILGEDEWKAVYTVIHQTKPPKKPPTTEDMIYMIASLGGHLGRTHDGPPGPKTMWIGMQRMMDLAIGWRAFGPPNFQ